ncbi:MAG: alpha-methylacyl-CoA racemase [Actinomycetota bacterium]|nr:alpha-methylacyl-CoA racemase [Actinomycetota bacterium]
MSERPLAHLRVLDLSRLQPGAYCTGMLADLGADVLRVEQPGSGDPLRGIPGAAEAYNRGKRSMTLDLKHERAPEILRRLVAEVDVVVESGRPGALAARGVGYEQLSEPDPALVWCAITGFGQDSPYADRPAHDLTLLGYSGLLDLMAGTTVPPTPDFVLAVPFGALVAVVGILSALTERAQTGRGRFVDTSIADSATWILGEAVARVAAGQPAGWGQSASRRAYRGADGRLVTLAAAEPRTWAAFCAALDRPDLADRAWGPPEAQEALASELEALFASRPAAEWLDLLVDAGAGFGPVNTVSDLLDDPHVQARGSVVPLEGDPANARVLRSPVRLLDADGDEAPFAPSPPPSSGAHTDEALAAAGFTSDEIDGLRRDGAI